MYNIRLFPAFVLCALCLASCSKPEGAIYTGEAGFSFASTVLNAEVVAEDDGLLEVPLYRGNLDINNARVHFQFDISEAGASEPVWSDVDINGIFSLLSTKVMFSDISYRAYAKIQYGSVNLLGFNDKYRMRLYVENQASPSHRDTTVITISRKLTFEEVGNCTLWDHCMFDNAYQCRLMKAKECDMYRVMDPYTEGLMAEDYAVNGLMQDPPAYIQFECHPDGKITYEKFHTGMLVPTPTGTTCMAWVYYPSDYKWGKDFKSRDADNKRLSDTKFQLCGVYCLPDFDYGFLDDGAYLIEIEIIK